VGWLKSVGFHSSERWFELYDKALVFFLFVSVAFLGIGGLNFFSSGSGISAWSISRTNFIFWLIGKVIRACRGGRGVTDFLRHPIALSLLIFFLTVAVSLLPDFHDGGDFRYFLFGCMHALMVMDLVKTGGRFRSLFLLLALPAALLTLRGIVYDPALLYFTPIQHLGFPLAARLGFPMDHPNTAGYVLSMTIPLAAVLVLGRTGWVRGLSAASCAVQIFGLILTYSRGAWLGWAGAMLFMVAISKRWKAMLSILSIPLLLFIFVEPLRDRALTVANPAADPAISERVRLMTDALRLGAENPIFGIGYGRGRLKEALRHEYQGSVNEKNPIWHTHNVYIELFAETGLLGLGAFLWLLGRSHFEIIRLYPRPNSDRMMILGLGAAWTAAAVTGLGDVPFYHHETRILFFSLLGMILAASRLASRAES
jgi:putative inorganic carbon (HCO3(-)) transporter